MNVLLVNMPFGSRNRPSLALGLLKSELAAIGVPARVDNPAIRFAELIGDEAYVYLSDKAPPESLAGDWVFAGCLFGTDPARTAGYHDHLIRLFAGDSTADNQWDLIRFARSRAQPFIDDYVSVIDWSKYDIVGFTSTFCQNVASLALARRIKELNPRVAIVFGGANCEHQMGLGLHCSFSFIDFAVTGEADLAFPRLAEALRAGHSVHEIPGVVARHRGRSNCNSLSPDRVQLLDELPFPDFDEFFDQRGASSSERVAVMETARGCWWGDKHHCTFCGIDFPATYRSKSPDRAIQELIALRDRYGTRRFLMADDILDIRYFREFLPRLADLPESFSLFYETKANLTKKEVELLSRAGIRQIQPGIESFSTKILKLMDKGVSTPQNVQLLKWCEEYGIEARWNLLYGFPGEDPTQYVTMARTIDAFHHLRPPQACGPVRLDRFSPYFRRATDYGLVNVRPTAAYGHIYDLPAVRLKQIAYYFDFDFRDGRDPTSYTARIREGTRRWRNAYQPGSLTYHEDRRLLTILDQRTGTPRRHQYSGWRRDLYLHCDQARGTEQVETFARERGVFDGDLRRFLDGLLEAGLMVAVDNRYLSLAVRSPSLSGPTPRSYSWANSVWGSAEPTRQ